MTELEALQARHSVRKFTDKIIDEETKAILETAIDKCNKESGLHIQLCTDEPEAFKASKASYGNFQNCKNYIAIVAKAGDDEKCGYYGQKIVLAAQMSGLNTCWVVLTYKKSKAVYQCNNGEKLVILIALGYGQTQGVAHKSKEIKKLFAVNGEAPDWFMAGMKAATLAPTAMNQQRFLITLDGNIVTAKPLTSIVGHTKIDLGIVKYNFEVGAGKENFKWSK